MEIDLESKIKQILAPHMLRIEQLQEDIKRKDVEITTLKHAVYNLQRMLDNKPGAANTQNKFATQTQPQKPNTTTRPQTQQSLQKEKKEEKEKTEPIQPRPSVSQKQPRRQTVEKGGEGSIKADFGRTHQWVYPPTNYQSQQLQLPSAKLEPYKILGYNGKNSRHNLFYINDTTIVYCAASLVVIQDLNTLEQKILMGHSNDITCLAYNPTHQVIASGQIDPKGEETPFICIWDIQGNLIKKLYFHKNSVGQLAFSTDGKHLLSIGGDNDHTAAV